MLCQQYLWTLVCCVLLQDNLRSFLLCETVRTLLQQYASW